MKTDSGLPVSVPPPGQPLRRRILGRPSTRLGWWSVALAAIFLALFLALLSVEALEYVPQTTVLLPLYAIATLLIGIAAGVAGLLAVVRRHERSWLVWLTILVGILALAIILLELLEFLEFLVTQ